MFIREIGTEEGNKLLASKGNDGFKTVFNGKNFKGWGGPVDNYVVNDGTIQCKKGSGGTIYYDKELSDFSVRFEYKVPPGGNNGLAIRYPGSGDTAYVGMCELQVLDDTARNMLNFTRRSTMPPPTAWWQPSAVINVRLVTGISSKSRLWVPRSPSR